MPHQVNTVAFGGFWAEAGFWALEPSRSPPCDTFVQTIWVRATPHEFLVKGPVNDD
ncbi:unannotated protein [freshwater metagenome]|uniref:Unannotated protein n=1 Tax=freshwater metagenome TaxID=449393 RepID=A0A6J5YPG3_9ZZZZ